MLSSRKFTVALNQYGKPATSQPQEGLDLFLGELSLWNLFGGSREDPFTRPSSFDLAQSSPRPLFPKTVNENWGK